LILNFTTSYENESVLVPLKGTVNVNIDWGDGTTLTSHTAESNYKHYYATPGNYVVTITGTLSHFGISKYYNFSRGNLISVESWDNVGLTDLSYAFKNASNLISVPSTIPSTVVNCSNMFYNAKNFNSDISGWDVSNVTDMSNMFDFNYAFNADISGWDVSNVTNMSAMFASTKMFNADISGWNVSNVTDMSNMFASAVMFNADISGWDVSNVTDMDEMFLNTQSFNFNISDWNVSSVNNMASMFMYAEDINIDISNWDVSNVMFMDEMFKGSHDFNGDISKWDVSNVTDMSYMFEKATSFDQDLGNWNVSNVTSMLRMFEEAKNFDQNLGSWDVSKVTNMSSMFSACSLSTENYSNILIGWANQQVNKNLDFSGGLSKYNSAGEIARYTLTNKYNWSIRDLGLDITSSIDQNENIPIKYSLSQNYPNPFNPTTSIEYSVPSKEYVTLKVYDIQGREVATLVNEPKEAGKYTVNFDAAKLASGLYIYKLKCGNQVSSKKMLLIK
jgi:surface protein